LEANGGVQPRKYGDMALSLAGFLLGLPLFHGSNDSTPFTATMHSNRPKLADQIDAIRTLCHSLCSEQTAGLSFHPIS